MNKEPQKIYYDEMSSEDMEKFGAEFYECNNCGHKPLIWQTVANDAICEGCGTWQKDIVPDGLTSNETIRWYMDREQEKNASQQQVTDLDKALNTIEATADYYHQMISEQSPYWYQCYWAALDLLERIKGLPENSLMAEHDKTCGCEA
jgi:hypothetical protein